MAREIGDRAADRELAGDDSPVYRYKREKLLRWLRQVPVADKEVLEVGCGPGGNLSVLQDGRPRRLVGCDLAPAMVELARTQVGDNVELNVVDGRTLPYPAQGFDIVLTVTVLQHNREDAMTALLSEICRVSRGRVYLFEDVSSRHVSRGSMFFRPVNAYEAVCNASGFRLVAAQPIGVHVSEAAGRFLRRATLSRRAEGSPSTRRHILAERAALPLLKRLDAAVPQRRGLTMMVFERTAEP